MSKKICWVLNDCSGYGANASLHDLLFDASENELVFCSPGRGPDFTERCAKIQLKYFSTWHGSYSLLAIFRQGVQLFLNAIAATQFLIWKKAQGIDLVVLNSSAITFLNIPIALGLIKSRIHIREDMRGHYWLAYPRWLQQLTYSKASLIFSSNYLKEAISRTGVVVPDVIQLTPHDQNLDRDRDIDILIVGSITPDKNILQALTAIKTLGSVNVTIVGEGPAEYTAELKRIAGSLVSFVGWKETVDDFYKRSKIVLSPSKNEGLGRVIVEGLWFGCWVISHNSGEPRNISKGTSNMRCFTNFEELSHIIPPMLAQQTNNMKDNFFLPYGKKDYLQIYEA